MKTWQEVVALQEAITEAENRFERATAEARRERAATINPLNERIRSFEKSYGETLQLMAEAKNAAPVSRNGFALQHSYIEFFVTGPTISWHNPDEMNEEFSATWDEIEAFEKEMAS